MFRLFAALFIVFSSAAAEAQPAGPMAFQFGEQTLSLEWQQLSRLNQNRLRREGLLDQKVIVRVSFRLRFRPTGVSSLPLRTKKGLDRDSAIAFAVHIPVCRTSTDFPGR